MDKWSQEDIDFMKNSQGKYTLIELSEILNRSTYSVKNKCARLKLKTGIERRMQFVCLNCGIEFSDYKRCDRKYCSQFCLGTHLGKTRIHTEETKKKISISNILFNKNKPKKIPIPKTVVLRKCKFCTNLLEPKSKRLICDNCKNEYYKFYRSSCKFNFSLKDFSFLFEVKDFDNISKFGFYSASNKGSNLNGISRDHMMSVHDGFKLKVPYFIMRHPANCSLMLQRDNQKKNKKSSISLIDLYRNIIELEDIKRYLTEDEMLYVNEHYSILNNINIAV